jgi:hypothetical protein
MVSERHAPIMPDLISSPMPSKTWDFVGAAIKGSGQALSFFDRSSHARHIVLDKE